MVDGAQGNVLKKKWENGRRCPGPGPKEEVRKWSTVPRARPQRRSRKIVDGAQGGKMVDGAQGKVLKKR